jgi:hypothetical protein
VNQGEGAALLRVFFYMCCVDALLRGGRFDGGFVEADRPQRPKGAVH